MNDENVNKVLNFLEENHYDYDNFIKIEKNILLKFISNIPYEDFKTGFYRYIKKRQIKIPIWKMTNENEKMNKSNRVAPQLIFKQ